MAAHARPRDVALIGRSASTWPAAVAALSGSTMVGFMPLLARRLYADGLSAPSMLFWRYDLAIVALAAAALFMQLDLRRILRGGGWRIVLLGATLGAAQTLCFWESLKTLETSIAVLLFYTYPAVTLALDRLIVKQPIRPVAVLCIAMILGGAALITLPGLLGATGFAILANAELVTVVVIGTLVLGEEITPGRALGGLLIVAGIVTHALARRGAAHAPRSAPRPIPAGGTWKTKVS